ncbi:DpnD/PcfM family protein [Ruminococcus albus]|uniref:DpnD/PcfM family protein n=1 Tax=Ruminococcus albus TaxID=1264 RepID=UPI001D15AEBE|nr:DpnD/PcfM family protein [Ruminococcus albus]MCC3352085.1 DpnD/PcfM family protein [Ruminococcus albus 8]
MKKFNVIITETLRKVVTVEAETAEDPKRSLMQHGIIANTFLKLNNLQVSSFTVRNDKDGVEIEESMLKIIV